MSKGINWSAVIQTVTDSWLPFLGWLAAAAVVWLVAGTIRRNR